MSFNDLKLIPALQKALTKQKYTMPTPIQLKAIPGLLEGNDLIGIAQTGTGKTAAFILPILQRMTESRPKIIKTLVLAPTRELAAQIGESFAAYGEFLKYKHTVVFGGVPQGRQVRALTNGVDILVATPGRLLDLMNQRKLTLRNIEFFVLDEADRMLDMGFLPDIKKIISKLPDKRQSLFFSATMSSQVNELAKKLLKNPIHVQVITQATTVDRVKQCVFFVDSATKEKLLLQLLKQKNLTSVLIFTRTKHKANKLAVFLSKNGVCSDAIHGNKSQGARTKAIKDFKTGRTKVLVATDIAARGIDIDNISHVINYELPSDSENYVHRIGRTARAGSEGTAYSFCAAEERGHFNDIEKLIRQKIDVMDHEFHSETAKNAVGAASKPARRFSRKPRSRDGSRNATRKTFSKGRSSSGSGKKSFSKEGRSSAKGGFVKKSFSKGGSGKKSFSKEGRSSAKGGSGKKSFSKEGRSSAKGGFVKKSFS
ncbi:DEAD/DEAH box helicase, partial [Candidatus Woesearchaeota archaeon]|nr:DEAD/DEAH box helicase [Candidatus Woesearchaeota archaeon]